MTIDEGGRTSNDVRAKIGETAALTYATKRKKGGRRKAVINRPQIGCGSTVGRGPGVRSQRWPRRRPAFVGRWLDLSVSDDRLCCDVVS